MAGLTLVAQRVLHLSPPMAAGMFAGTLTNTPTLAAELEFLRRAGAGSAEPVVGYSLTYPVGVLGMIVALMVARRRMRPLASRTPERPGITAGTALLRLPFGTLAGTLAGLQTQPAVLGFALEQAKDESPNVGYATVYPVAMIAKVILGQLLLAIMR